MKVAGSLRDRVMAACGAKPGSVEDYPFGDEVAVFKVVGKMFALVTLGPAASMPMWSGLVVMTIAIDRVAALLDAN